MIYLIAAYRSLRSIGGEMAEAGLVESHFFTESNPHLAGGEQGHAPGIIDNGRGRCWGSRFHQWQQIQSRLAFAPLHVALHDGHAQRGQLRMLGRAVGQHIRKGSGSGEGSVRKGFVLKMRQGFIPVAASQEEGKAAGPEAWRAVEARHPFVVLVVVAAPGDGAPAGLDGQFRQSSEVGNLFVRGAQVRGGERCAKGLGGRVNLGVEARREQVVLAPESLFMAALHLPQQFCRRIATALALMVGCEAHEGPRVEAGVQGAAPVFGRAGGPSVHALGVGLPHVHGPGFRNHRIKDLEGTLRVFVIRQEIGTQQQAALGIHGLASGQGLVGFRQAPGLFQRPQPGFQGRSIVGKHLRLRLAQGDDIGEVRMPIRPGDAFLGERHLCVWRKTWNCFFRGPEGGRHFEV